MNADLVAVPIADLEQLISRTSQRWLTTDDAAAYCACSSKSLQRAASRGDLSPSKAIRGRLTFDRRQLDAWMMSGMT